MRVAVTGAILLLGSAGQAQAATLVGAPISGAAANCSAGYTWVQDASDPGQESYTVPAGGGVITSWEHAILGPTPGTATMRLMIFRKTGTNAYQAVARSTTETLTSSGLKQYPTSISVAGGELLGLRTDGTGETECVRDAASGSIAVAGTFDPAINEVFNPIDTATAAALNLGALLEADNDCDGLGDETQDPSVTSCPVPPPDNGGPPPADTDPPETTITKNPPNKLTKGKAKYKFVADEQGSTFECKIDKKPFKACRSPKKIKHLDEGKHRFRVRATDLAGNVGAADKDRFKVVG